LSKTFNIISTTVALLALLSCQPAESPSSDTNQNSGVTAPAAPTNLTATPGNGEASFTWSASTGATSYELRYTTATSFVWDAATPVAGSVISGYQLKDLSNGQAYLVAVRAVNSAGASPVSAVVTVTPQADLPAAPTIGSNAVWSGQVTISWAAVDGVTDYRVRVIDSSGSTVKNEVVTTLGYTATGLTDGASYAFVVASVAAAGESAGSSPVVLRPVSQLGTDGALDGTWTWSETRTQPTVRTLTVKHTFSGADYSAEETNPDNAGDHLWLKGSFEYRAVDKAVVVTVTQQSTDNTSWTILETPRIVVYRNLLINGRWHPDAWVRASDGHELGGTWRTVGVQSEAEPSTFYLVEYVFPASDNTVTVNARPLVTDPDTGFLTVGAATKTATDTFTRTGTSPDVTVNFADQDLSLKLTFLSTDLIDAGELDTPARTGTLFTQP